MTTTQALVPRLVPFEDSLLKNTALVGAAVLLLSLLAQISIPLPWTPVPITGQTFGVALIALLWGARLALPSLGAYVGLGALGAPIFSAGAAGLAGPTCGYLLGMIVASFLVGRLSDRGWAKRALTAWVASALGSVVIFSCGLAWLSFYVPRENLLAMGLLPFLPGDFVKNITAALIVSRLNKRTEASE